MQITLHRQIGDNYSCASVVLHSCTHIFSNLHFGTVIFGRVLQQQEKKKPKTKHRYMNIDVHYRCNVMPVCLPVRAFWHLNLYLNSGVTSGTCASVFNRERIYFWSQMLEDSGSVLTAVWR